MTAVCTTVAAQTPDGEIAATRPGPSRPWSISTPWRTEARGARSDQTPAQIRQLMRKMVGFWYPAEAQNLVFETRTVGDTSEEIFAVTEEDAAADEAYRRQALIIATLCGAARGMLDVDDRGLGLQRTQDGRRVLAMLERAKGLVGEVRGAALKESRIE